MKRSRLTVNRRRRRGSFILAFLFCIVLPLLAIYIGLNITERFVLPALNTEDVLDELGLEGEGENDDVTSPVAESPEPQESPIGDVTLVGEINPFSIYTIQIASLSDKENLDRLISQLNQNKKSYIAYQIDNSYKVYALGYTKRAYIEASLTSLRETFSDAYISEMHLPIREVMAGEEDHSTVDGIVMAINELIDNVDQQSEEWYIFFQKEGDLTNYIELLKKQQTILGALKDGIDKVGDIKGLPDKMAIDKMIHYQDSNINKSLELLEGAAEIEEYRLYSLYLDSLFRIVEVIK
ncbi:SPOR domain-containing protein [Alkaliphilus serpentinus]|uniref:SPOR domain-containing protein n=1 Tax=Alkaliphilus serpentinus TaxID=1482731 RepID=A0A833M7X0_9FIRM|nr:SPOR domain-containing protein [Alkaliphilus serpentinus]KAB3531457.1 SPOR domain-containing protein [Alkaliphilus serpentinus]